MCFLSVCIFVYLWFQFFSSPWLRASVFSQA
jgi:hypothetical protein